MEVNEPSPPVHIQSHLSFFQVCNKCVRCKCCGATKPGKSWDAQWSHDFSMCHDCAKLFAKRKCRASPLMLYTCPEPVDSFSFFLSGNFCLLCNKCYEDDEAESKMVECGRCHHRVHAKCEKLTGQYLSVCLPGVC